MHTLSPVRLHFEKWEDPFVTRVIKDIRLLLESEYLEVPRMNNLTQSSVEINFRIIVFD